MRRILLVVRFVFVLVVLWLPLEFMRAHMTDGLPARVQFASMALPILVALTAAVGNHRRITRKHAR